ncbi:hypothetical protein ACC699_39355, partial [Rhizobium ruizarguesonis]
QPYKLSRLLEKIGNLLISLVRACLDRGFHKALRANKLSAPLAKTEIRLSTLGLDPLPPWRRRT